MSRNSSRIDRAARLLLSSIAGTLHARVSALALAQMRGAEQALMNAELLVPGRSSMLCFGVVAQE